MARERWAAIIGDLPPAAPALIRPDMTDGVHHCYRDGAEFEETYRNGVRCGPARAWNYDESFNEFDDLPTRQRTTLRREGHYEGGCAHGTFRFYNDIGQLTQQVDYERGWPHGHVEVLPEASLGLCEIATVEYRQGQPTSWSIPPFAYASVALERAEAAPATLAQLAAQGPVILISCHTTQDHALNKRAESELAQLDDLTVLGIGPTPGRGTVGSRSIEIVADGSGRLRRAYGLRHEEWMDVTAIAAGGKFMGAGQLKHFRFTRDRIDDQRVALK